MVGKIGKVFGLNGLSLILNEGKEDFLIRWLDDPEEEKWELFISKKDFKEISLQVIRK